MAKKQKKDKFRAREAAKYKRPIPSREFILQTMGEKSRPISRQNLVNLLYLKHTHEKEALKYRLKAMVRDRQLIKNRTGLYTLPSQLSLIKGRLQTTKKGVGFVIPEEGGPDIFIPTSDMRHLLNNDLVLATITSFNKRRGQPEGRVIEVLEHDNQPIIGRFFKERGTNFIEPSDQTFSQNIVVPPDQTLKAKLGQYVLFELLPPRRLHRQPAGRVTKIIGEEMTPGLEIELSLHTYHLPHRWNKEVKTAIKRCASPDFNELTTYRDLTHLNFVTIDGADAKDFDDAVYCEKRKEGFKLFVAIADVSYYVQPESELDKEAFNRGNSVYFPTTVIPMLPEKLSNGLCSLKPNEKRLTLICEMNFDKEGKMTRYKFYEAIIESKERFTYTQIAKLLKNPQHRLIEDLLNFYRLYQKLTKQRQLRGAIDFDTIETRITFNERGKIKEIRPYERNEAHRMIEEAMLASNICAANFLSKTNLPFLYRNHKAPEAEKVESLRQFLAPFGLRLSKRKAPTSIDYVKLLDRIENRPDRHILQTVLLRSLSQARYEPENQTHFGLAYQNYTHFTSPIRRYSDLITHRAIKHRLHRKGIKSFSYTFEEMENIGQHCSMTERRADEATRDAINWLKCYYMKDKVGQEFEGIISSVTNFGLFVELKDIYVEGLIHITALKHDYYQYDETHRLLRGRGRGKVYRLGDCVKVLVARVDLDKQNIDLELI